MRFLAGIVVCLPLSSLWAQQYVISTVAGGSPAPAAAAATSLALGQPGRVALDPAGDVYFTALNSVYEIESGGNAVRIAGNGRAGFSGDNGPATNAELNSPQGLAIDSAGDVYIADTGNERIRMVSPNGIITTIAGTGVPGSGGDYGDPTQAQLHLPVAVALDSSDNLYIADSANNVVRMIANGIIVPFAGNYIPGYSNDGQSAVIAALYAPTDICFDLNGNLFIADSLNGRIREVSGGIITSVAGPVSSIPTAYTEGGSATATLFTNPRSVAVDTTDNLYVADSDANRIRKITIAKDIINTYVGSGNPGFSGDGGMATSAQINTPTNVVIDASGNVYFVDFGNSRVRQVNSSGTINTVAGNGITGYSGDGGAAESALLHEPSSVAVAPSGVFYISDTNNQRVREVTGGIISTLTGNGTAGYAGDGGAPASGQVNYPGGLAVDGSGNLYIADTVNQRVRKISGGVITTVAGNGTAGNSGNGAAAVNAELDAPVAVAVDGGGNLFIADFNNDVVRKVTAAGVISTVAGNGSPGYSGDGGGAVTAQLKGPVSVAVDGAGNLYIADSGNSVVRKVTPGGLISTYAGNGTLGSSGDGGYATAAQLATPAGVAVDSSGNLYIADSGAGTVRLVNAAGLISTIAGGGGVGYSGDGGPAVGAQFNSLSGIALDASGDVYLADRGNNAIRFLQLVAAVPSTGMVTNSASNLSGPIAPGEIVTVFGSGIGPQTLMASTPTNNTLPTEVGGATVYIGGIPAPMLYTWTSQASVVVPYEVTPGNTSVTVSYGGQVSLELPVQVAPTAPGIFTVDQSGQGQAVAFNETGTMNSPTTPVVEGTVIIVYMTGAGLVTPSEPDGVFAFVQPLLPVTATIGGIASDVQFVAGDYTLTPGIIRVFIRVPVGITGSAIPVIVTVGGVSTQYGVTIAVQ